MEVFLHGGEEDNMGDEHDDDDTTMLGRVDMQRVGVEV
jgi:hypothetical protein